MRFLVFQHVAIEHPGILRDFMAADGVAWDAVELDEGQPIPPLEGYDALLVIRLLMIGAAAIYTPQAASAVQSLVAPDRRAASIGFVFLGWSVASAAAMWSGCEAPIRSQLRTGDSVITRCG